MTNGIEPLSASTVRSHATVEDVRAFWNRNPLWTGESNIEPGSMAFFEEHRRICRDDCFAGSVDERLFMPNDKNAKVLDLGCGIGFWLVEFWQRGFRSLTGADISDASLEMARKRCAIYGLDVLFHQANAEALEFADASFDHVNCQGVIHHTPDTQAALSEIARVLKAGGTASVSVYYKNFVLRNWSVFRPFARIAGAVGSRLKGRGREQIYKLPDADEIIRHYDGNDNPIGKAYSVAQFRAMAEPYFEIEDVIYHFFPARSLPVGLPKFVHRLLDRKLPFMVYFNLRRHTFPVKTAD
jgi:ubiquinone/menaquinone biosynthesis C-methylase UbiE